MEIFKIKDLTFKYPNSELNAISDVTLSFESGEFITVCGRSGSGKSTLLRLLKPTMAPYGEIKGEIQFDGRILSETGFREESERIGFVGQNPESQIVTDKVWHELAFGAESLGLSTGEIRRRVAETAAFFGIDSWFHKKVEELSGGQKQMLNLASVMVMQPDVLILDEPTAQLDPIAAQNFLEVVSKINRELGITVILAEHRLESVFSLSSRVVVLDEGRITADGDAREVGYALKKNQHSMLAALPSAMRIFLEVENEGECPVTVCEGRKWLGEYIKTNEFKTNKRSEDGHNSEVVLEAKDVWFRYEKNLPDVICGMSMKAKKGEIYAILGGNGTGKTTALTLLSGVRKAYSGKIKTNKSKICMIPQNAQLLFTQKTIELDLIEMLEGRGLTEKEKKERIDTLAGLCDINRILKKHPYDISGGETQKAALAKALLAEPDVLLLDEPTKGIDAHFKIQYADILKKLKSEGKAIVIVSHDIEFCAEFANRCAMFFDGKIVSEATSREFFSGNMFYTTAAGRIAKNIIPDAVLNEDIIQACKREDDK